MKTIPAFGLVTSAFYRELESQVGAETLKQVLTSYLAYRPQDWVSFAYIAVDDYKEIYPEKEKATFENFLGYLKQEYGIEMFMESFIFSDVVALSEKLLK